jgi:hypothetical protein
MLADPVESEIVAPEAATSADASSIEVAASTSGEPEPDAVVAGQPTLSQGGYVGGPVPSVASEAAEGVLEDPAAGAESAVIAPLLLTAGVVVDAPPPPIVGADKRAVEVVELSSLQPTAAVKEVALATSQPIVVPQERDAPEGAARDLP